MALEVASLFGRVRADISDGKRKLKDIRGDFDQTGDSIKRSGGAIENNLKTAVIGAVGAFGALEVARRGLQLVQLASDVEETAAKFDTVFGPASARARAELNQLAEDINRNQFALQEFAAGFQDTFVPLGFAREEASKLSVQMTELTADLASFNNVAEPETARALESALVGNHEAVRQFGIVITQATLDQELLNMGIRGGVRAATEKQKVMARLNLILEGTSDAQGDAARTSDSFANQLRGLKGDAKELGVEIGQGLLPAATNLVQALSEGTNVILEHKQAIDDWAESADRNQVIATSLISGIDLLGEETQEGATHWDTYRDKVLAASSAMGGATDVSREFADEQARLQSIVGTDAKVVADETALIRQTEEDVGTSDALGRMQTIAEQEKDIREDLAMEEKRQAQQVASSRAQTHSKLMRQMERREQERIDKVRSAVEGAIDLDISVGEHDFLLQQFGMRPDAVNEAGRRLEDVVQNGIASPWVNSFKELRGLAGDELKATAVKLQQDIDKFLRPDLLNREAILRNAREALVGQQNRENLVRDLTSQLIGEGFAEGDVKKALGAQFGMVGKVATDAIKDGADAGSVDLVGQITAAEEQNIQTNLDSAKAIGKRWGAAFAEGAVGGVGEAGLIQAIAGQVLTELELAAQTEQ